MVLFSLPPRKTIVQAIRFGIVGTMATLLHYGLYYLLLTVDVRVGLAYTAGYLLSFLLNFYLSVVFTFRCRPSWHNFIGMSGAHAVNYLLQITLLAFFLWIGVAEKLVPIPVYAVAVPVNFLLVRFAFKRKH